MATPDDASVTYRQNFGDAGRAAEYDDVVYGPKTWSTLVWAQERECLRRLLADPEFGGGRERYLDFACGTGRVTGFVASDFHESVGVDISEAMLARARDTVPDATFVRCDILDEPEVVPGPFDIITCFRFILNAEPADRLPALLWMRRQLRNESSRLVINNHSNLWTHKALTHGARQVLRRGRGVTGNVLSHRQMLSLVQHAGLTVESVQGTGYLGGTLLRVTPYGVMTRLQRRLGAVRPLRRLGEDQIYVLSRR